MLAAAETGTQSLPQTLSRDLGKMKGKGRGPGLVGIQTEVARRQGVKSDARLHLGPRRDPSRSGQNVNTKSACYGLARHGFRGLSAAAKEAAVALGGIDILVTSAAVTGPNMSTWEYSAEDWRRVIDINVNGVFYCNKAVVPYMLKRDWGRIINIASIAGKEGNPNAPAYSTSKAAVIGMTKSLGKELAKTRITANCVTPAAVQTAIFRQMTDQHIEFMLSKDPDGALWQGRGSSGTDCWIASEECSFHDRVGVRHFRRPCDLLREPGWTNSVSLGVADESLSQNGRSWQSRDQTVACSSKKRWHTTAGGGGCLPKSSFSSTHDFCRDRDRPPGPSLAARRRSTGRRW